MSQRVVASAALISLAAAGTLLFVQPSGTPGLAVEGRSLAADTRSHSPLISDQQGAEGSSAGFGGLFAGLALGLLVSLSGAGAVRAEEAAAPPPAPPAPPVNLSVVPDHRTATKDELKAWQKAWGKKQYLEKTDMFLNKAYALPTTGAGRYKQFGIDSGSPVRQIPDADDGTYPLPKSKTTKPAPDADLLARVKPFLKDSKYGNYYSPSSPFAYAPK